VSQDQDSISKKVVLYRVPGVDDVRVRRDEPYSESDAGGLTMDLYYPPDSSSGVRLPAVIIVAGFPDPGCQRIFGCRFKEMGSSTSWARLIDSRYSRSSRLAREAPRPSRCDATLSPPAAGAPFRELRTPTTRAALRAPSGRPAPGPDRCCLGDRRHGPDVTGRSAS
jgi:hypothetical protein